MKITMRRTAIGSIGHFVAGKTYDVDEKTARALADADACDVPDAFARAEPAPEPELEPAEAATDAAAETAETAESPKPKRKPRARRPRKKPSE